MLQITSQEDYLQFHSQENLKKKKIYHLNLLKDLISQIYIQATIKVYFRARKYQPSFFRPSQPRPRIVFKFFPQYLPISTLPTFLVSTFLISSLPSPLLLPPSSAGEEIYIRVPDCKKGKKVHEKVFGSRPANIVHSKLFPLYFPPLFYLSFDLLVLSSSC